MKKILLLILIFLAYPVNAKETHYTLYGPFSNYQDNSIEKTDLIKVETALFHKFYKEEIVNGDYYFEGFNPIDYPYVNKEDYVYTDYSNWDISVPASSLNRIVESKIKYEYANMKEVRYIHFYNLSGGNGALRITELNIYSGIKEIPFSTYCTSCSPYFTTGINDNEVAENQSAVYNGAYLRVDLGNYYDPASLKIDMYLYDVETVAKKYSIALSKESDVNKKYAFQTYIDYFKSKNYDDTFKRSISINNMVLERPEYYEFQESLTPVTKTKTNIVVNTTYYRFKDTKYKYYAKNIIDSDYMLEKTEEYPFIYPNISKEYYRYQKRNKIELDNYIVLNDNELVSKYITSSKEYNIIGNIDYHKNAIYDINVELEELKIPVKVEVNYSSNIIKEPDIVIPVEEETKPSVDIPVKEETKPSIDVPVKEIPKENVVIPVKETTKPIKTPIVQNVIPKENVVIKEDNKEIVIEKEKPNIVKTKSSKSLFQAFYLYILAIIIAALIIIKKHI